MRFFLPILIVISTAAATYAYNVTAVVSEMRTGEKCIGATYKIYQPADSAKTRLIGVTDTDGVINRSLPSPGKYMLEVEYLGCKDGRVPFEVSEKTPDAKLKEIRLEQDDETLEELIVEARRKLVSSDGGTLTYNAAEDPTSKSSTTLEMLRRVPMVTVDAEDNVKVNGQSNFKILINSKEDPMLSGDIKTVLKSMPASTIKKIEVITEPGAKYDAEGVGGVLNIVTQAKTTVEGYLLNVNLMGNTRGAGGNAYGMTKIKNVTASISGNYYTSTFHLDHSDYTTTQEIFSAKRDHLQTTRGRSNQYPYHNYGVNFNLSWEPDTLNLYTISYNFGKYSNNPRSNETVTMQDIDMKKVWSYSRLSEVDYEGMWMGAMASYQHTFRKQGHHMILSYMFSHDKGDNDSKTSTFDLDGITVPTPWRTRTSDNHSFKHTLQADYANPFDGKSLIEVGFKGTWYPQSSDARSGYGETADIIVDNEAERIKLKQIQDVVAAYASFTGNYGKFGVKAGVRYEHTRLGLRYRIGDHPDFTSDLNDVVPNAALTYRFTGASNLRLAYQMRIWRPGVSQLNPFRNTMTIGEVSYGNPDLKSENNNNVSLSYSNYGGMFGGQLSFGFSKTDNSIERYQFVDSKNIINSTYDNIGRSSRTSLNGNLQFNPKSWLSVSLWLSGTYVDMRADSPKLKASNSGWTGNYNVNVDYTFPFNTRVSAYAGGGSRWISLQETGGSGWSYYGLGLSHEFLKSKRLTVQLNAGNFFAPHRTWSSTTETKDLRISSTGRYTAWDLNLGISYRFGSLQARVKSTEANMDQESGTASAGGNGSQGGSNGGGH